jgi:glycerophosphoryl diester phosphodiesterase
MSGIKAVPLALTWLTSRPIAHRGLHDISAGVVENTASAFNAAIAGNYAIETDLQVSADGEAMVYHDYALGRLTEGSERLSTLPAAQIKAAPFKVGNDRILTLGGLCDLVAGRVPLVIELKSDFNGDIRLAARAVEVLKNYPGPFAVMSFDPAQVGAVRRIAPGFTRGIVAASRFVHAGGRPLSRTDWFRLTYLLHAPWTRPHFVSYAADDLPSIAPGIARGLGLPLITWTIRSDADRRRVLRYCDQVTFEGFRA